MYCSYVRRPRLVRSIVLLFFALILPTGATAAGSVTLAWDANGEDDLAGYEIVYGTSSRSYTGSIDVGDRTTYTVQELREDRTYFFAVRAYNKDGRFSPDSEEVSIRIEPPPPPAPAPTPPEDPDPPEEPRRPQPPRGPPPEPPRGPRPHQSFFAEGVEAAAFQTRFALLNPTDEPADVVMAFENERGEQYTRTLVLGPRTRTTVAADSVRELAGQSFATHIESDAPIVVDRTVAWGPGHYGAHVEGALSAPAPVWYLTEGVTAPGLLDLFYLVQNPTDSPAVIAVTYLLAHGREPEVRHYTVAPQSRLTIWVNGEGGPLAGTEVSAVVESTNGVPVIAERALYLSGRRQPFMAGSASAGVTSPETRWFFGEGATGRFFDLFLLLANPHDEAAEVRATYLLPGGQTVRRRYTIDPRSRRTIYVDREADALEETSVSTILESTNGVSFVAERSMWWPGPTAAQWYETHSAFGATATSARWAVAEGEVGGADGRQTYLLVANTSATAARVRVTVLFEGGGRARQIYTLPPKSRTDIPIARDFPESHGRRFGTLVESVGNQPAALVVEHAHYWNWRGRVLAAGGVALASPLP